MNRFYFSDKGITRKMGCPNLWPVHDRQFSQTPRQVFAEPGLVIHIEPKICGGIPRARIAVFNACNVRFRPHYNDPAKEMMTGGCIMNATYFNNGDTIINSFLTARDINNQEQLEAEWRAREACIPALKQAVDMFLQYFPKVEL